MEDITVALVVIAGGAGFCQLAGDLRQVVRGSAKVTHKQWYIITHKVGKHNDSDDLYQCKSHDHLIQHCIGPSG